MIAALGGGAVVIVAAVFLLSNRGSDAGAADAAPREPATPPAAAADAPSASRPASAPSLSGGTERPGSEPSRPAPAIDSAHLAAAEGHYERAKGLWNEGQTLRAKGDDAWTGKVTTAFDEMQQCRDVLSPYTGWLEEADISDWRIPADYDALRKVLGRHDSLFSKIKKVKQL